METDNSTIRILNELIHINNDRIAAYDFTIKTLKKEDQDLVRLFRQLIHESEGCKFELVSELRNLNTQSDEKTSFAGKIYNALQDVNEETFSREKAFTNCETIEDAVQETYQFALEELPQGSLCRKLISKQKADLRKSHNLMKQLRDIAKSH